MTLLIILLLWEVIIVHHWLPPLAEHAVETAWQLPLVVETKHDGHPPDRDDQADGDHDGDDGRGRLICILFLILSIGSWCVIFRCSFFFFGIIIVNFFLSIFVFISIIIITS